MRRRLALGAAGTTVLLAALDAYVVVGVLIDIVADMGIPVNRLERATPIVTGYLLGYVAAMPLLSQLSDRWGRRAVLQWCLAGFAVGSAVTALASGLPMLVAGRVLQGVAGGALLPVTMALVADLWSRRRRATVLGVVGGAQELGSVLGTVYGVGVAAAANAWRFTEQLEPQSWRWIFWINLPLTALAMVIVAFSVPKGRTAPDAVPDGTTADAGAPTMPDDHAGATGRTDRSSTAAPPVDLIGGLLLAVALGLLVVGLHNPNPAVSVLPSWGWPTLGGAALVFAGFVLWESRARVRLLDPAQVRLRRVLLVLGVAFATGAALLVTLVQVELFAQTLLGEDSAAAAFVLARFLVALPIGAVLGGLIATRAGDRIVAIIGMLLASTGYLLMTSWPVDVPMQTRLGLPMLDVDLGLAGLGLGLVIAPMSSAALRYAAPPQHGITSAAVVVARMTGMLIGVAALSAWGLHRFAVLTADLNTPLPIGISQAEYDRLLADYQHAIQSALLTQYHEVFLLTALICLVGAVLAVFLPGRIRADRPPSQKLSQNAG